MHAFLTNITLWDLHTLAEMHGHIRGGIQHHNNDKTKDCNVVGQIVCKYKTTQPNQRKKKKMDCINAKMKVKSKITQC